MPEESLDELSIADRITTLRRELYAATNERQTWQEDSYIFKQFENRLDRLEEVLKQIQSSLDRLEEKRGLSNG
jgi:hypothetical protein